MKSLAIDIETRSGADLREVGVYAYVADPAFTILLFAYSIDNGPARVLDLTHEKLPFAIWQALVDDTVIKTAFNAQFERVAIREYLQRESDTRVLLGEQDMVLRVELDPAAWHCTMVHAAYAGISGTLAWVASYLKVEERKDTSGMRLINLFSKPKRGGGFNAPADRPEEWADFMRYCAQDVRTEQAILKALNERYALMPAQEWAIYALDQRINDRGVLIDRDLACAACNLSNTATTKALDQMRLLTGCENPNSVTQLRHWLRVQGHEFPTLGKDYVDAAIAGGGLPDNIVEVLTLRKQTAKSSTKKYVVMRDASTCDDRVRGLFQYYGASTGRWAGRLLQVQNLPRGYSDEGLIALGRDLVKRRDSASIELLFESVPELLKQLIRTGIVAPEGKTFCVSDYSAIEARVIAWLAGEEWVLEVFRGDGKIYEATASRMLGKPLEAITKADRQKGKVATLALGYQGAHGALDRMGASQMGIDPSEYGRIVSTWRRANARIVNFWHDIEDACARVIEAGGIEAVGRVRVTRDRRCGALAIQLPSGRSLYYHEPRVTGGKIFFVDTSTRGGFLRVETYGGCLVENIVQATARDLLAEAMLALDRQGAQIVMHVHDEVVLEVDAEGAEATLARVNKIMCTNPSWAEGLPLDAAGFISPVYRKD